MNLFNILKSNKKLLTPEIQSYILNEEGVHIYNIGEHSKALEIWEQAIKINPNDCNVLINLSTTYPKFELYEKTIDVLKTLYPKMPSYKDKIVAFSLLYHIYNDYDDDTGKIEDRELIKYLNDIYSIEINFLNLPSIVDKINKPYDKDIICREQTILSQINDITYTTEFTPKSIIKTELTDILKWR